MTVAWLNLIGSLIAVVSWASLLWRVPALRLAPVVALTVTIAMYAVSYPWLLWLLSTGQSAGLWSRWLRPVGAVQWFCIAWVAIDLGRVAGHLRAVGRVGEGSPT